MTFFLKYQSQLRRIRPVVYNKLEKSIVNSVKLHGGNLKNEYHTMAAVFDDKSFGFWIDILSIIETLRRTLDELKPELYGHVCVFSEIIDCEKIPLILNSLPSVKIVSGIWCTNAVQKNLKFFFEFKETYRTNETFLRDRKIAELKNIKKLHGIKRPDSIRHAVKRFFNDSNAGGNVVLVGKDFIGKRNYLHWRCANSRENCTPLTIRFDSWGRTLNCFSDALSPEMRDFIKSRNVKIPKEADELYEALFTERLRTEYSKYSLSKARRLFQILSETYAGAVSGRRDSGVIILENIQNADSDMRQIIMDYQAYYKKNNIAVYATCALTELPSAWKPMFSVVINCFNAENPPVFRQETLSQSLWETAYACEMMGRYFPAFMFSDLFSEEGKNPASIERSLDMLLECGVIRSLQDPEVEIVGFIRGVEELLGKRASYIRGM
ncbi:MAG: hypothetical protein LBH18_06445, partial [Spirochaetaceae bacterium]|nr:hypothetical protein [Spirochaetaceae bacterium]